MIKPTTSYVIIPLGNSVSETDKFRLRDIVIKSPGIAHAVVTTNGFEDWIMADIWSGHENELDLDAMTRALNAPPGPTDCTCERDHDSHCPIHGMTRPGM